MDDLIGMVKGFAPGIATALVALWLVWQLVRFLNSLASRMK
jgi:hypothetical protein